MDTARIIQAAVVRADLWLCACARVLRLLGCVLAGAALGVILSDKAVRHP